MFPMGDAQSESKDYQKWSNGCELYDRIFSIASDAFDYENQIDCLPMAGIMAGLLLRYKIVTINVAVVKSKPDSTIVNITEKYFPRSVEELVDLHAFQIRVTISPVTTILMNNSTEKLTVA